jgi:NAD(P) transhydrogenase subunit alpha
MTKLFIPRERRALEARVAATPETVKKLSALGLEVRVEADAGRGAGFSDAEYEAAGARIATDATRAWSEADAVLKVAPPETGEGDPPIAGLARGAVLVGLLAPHEGESVERARALAEAGVTSLAMELVPRISRAQSMDALSSQSNVAGYKAVLLAAARSPRFFPLLMTAAGTVRPSRVVVVGAGVAGLQAVATAKRLGAVVEVSDIRPAVREQVESLGARFIELPDMESGEGSGGYAKEMGEEFLRRQREILTEHLRAADVVITTAQVPGKRAPILLSEEMIGAMKAGAVVVDLAAEQGGNCALTRAGEEVDANGVAILGPRNLAATVPRDASTLYARNLLVVIEHLVEDGALRIDPRDEITGAMLLTHDGQVTFAPLVERREEVTA